MQKKVQVPKRFFYCQFQMLTARTTCILEHGSSLTPNVKRGDSETDTRAQKIHRRRLSRITDWRQRWFWQRTWRNVENIQWGNIVTCLTCTVNAQGVFLPMSSSGSHGLYRIFNEPQWTNVNQYSRHWDIYVLCTLGVSISCLSLDSLIKLCFLAVFWQLLKRNKPSLTVTTYSVRMKDFLTKLHALPISWYS